jgi:hypothetical protein
MAARRPQAYMIVDSMLQCGTCTKKNTLCRWQLIAVEFQTVSVPDDADIIRQF